MIRAETLFLGYCVVSLFSCMPVRAELTATERLIKKEILRLDGEWEGNEDSIRIAFSSDRFEAGHFEMLEHVNSLTILTVFSLNIDDKAMESISKNSSLETVQFHNLSFTAGRRDDFRNLSRLTHMDFIKCNISPDGLVSISRIHSLKKLSLLDSKFSVASLYTLGRLRDLELLQISSDQTIDQSVIAKLKAAIPKCRIEVSSD